MSIISNDGDHLSLLMYYIRPPPLYGDHLCNGSDSGCSVWGGVSHNCSLNKFCLCSTSIYIKEEAIFRVTKGYTTTTSGRTSVLVRGARVVLGNTTRSSLAEERLQRSQGPAWKGGEPWGSVAARHKCSWWSRSRRYRMFQTSQLLCLQYNTRCMNI